MALEVRIERTRLVPVRIPLAGGHHEAVIVILEGEGERGIGEAAAIPARGQTLAEVHADLAAGGRRSPPARAAMETALLDLEARVRGVRVAELLGGVRRLEVRCNALVRARRPAEVAAEVEARSAAGFRTLKLKAVERAASLDLERLGAARWAAGRAARLRLDLNGSLSAAQAEVALPGLGACELELVEQPLSATAQMAEWERLLDTGTAPLAADESLAEPYLASALARAGAGMAIKLATVGGPRAALRLAAEASGPVLLASSYETSIGLAAALHTACALAQEPLDCGLATSDLLEEDLALGLGPAAACLRLPEGPGLGVELDTRALDRHRLDR